VNPIVSAKTRRKNVNLSRNTIILSTEKLAEKAVPMDPCENAGQPNEVPVVAGYADDDEEEDEEEDVDDLDEDDEEEDEDDEDLDDEDLDYDWEEVIDEDDE
jgi:segregation and condensation protein B